MKKNAYYFFAALSAVFMMVVLFSCSSDDEMFASGESAASVSELHVREIQMNAVIKGYGGVQSARMATRAAADNWKDGDKIYLRFTSPLGITTGEAIFNSAKSSWTLSYYGSLYEGTANTCTAVFIENSVKTEGTVITLNEKSVIYEDNTGSYLVEDGNLTVTANLTPKVGRLRFSGDEGKIMKVYGISHYTTYDAGTHLFTSTNVAFDNVVNTDGYTDYVYGYFSDETNPSVKLWIDKKEAYTRFFSSNVLTAGESGVMTLPSKAAHSSWTNGLTFNVKGKVMTMIPVEGGTFAMGSENEENSKPIHNVTLDSYCIGETEVTFDFYYTATNSSQTGSDVPIRMVKTSWVSFVNTLSQMTGAKFTIPTEAQWEYAARGGNKSKGYTYSGSNNIEDVAWYKTNSGDKHHPVKQKLPNELGLYDMSGNAREVVRDNWYTYTGSSQINPIDTSESTKWIARGGNYSSNESDCTVYYRIQWTSSSYYSNDSYWAGCRLALEN